MKIADSTPHLNRIRVVEQKPTNAEAQRTQRNAEEKIDSPSARFGSASARKNLCVPPRSLRSLRLACPVLTTWIRLKSSPRSRRRGYQTNLFGVLRIVFNGCLYEFGTQFSVSITRTSNSGALASVSLTLTSNSVRLLYDFGFQMTDFGKPPRNFSCPPSNFGTRLYDFGNELYDFGMLTSKFGRLETLIARKIPTASGVRTRCGLGQAALRDSAFSKRKRVVAACGCRNDNVCLVVVFAPAKTSAAQSGATDLHNRHWTLHSIRSARFTGGVFAGAKTSTSICIRQW